MDNNNNMSDHHAISFYNELTPDFVTIDQGIVHKSLIILYIN